MQLVPLEVNGEELRAFVAAYMDYPWEEDPSLIWVRVLDGVRCGRSSIVYCCTNAAAVSEIRLQYADSLVMW